jgi:hypothetical protein
MSKTRKKRSQSKKAIESALQIALEQAREAASKISLQHDNTPAPKAVSK